MYVCTVHTHAYSVMNVQGLFASLGHHRNIHDVCGPYQTS